MKFNIDGSALYVDFDIVVWAGGQGVEAGVRGESGRGRGVRGGGGESGIGERGESGRGRGRGRMCGDNINHLVKLIPENKVFHFLLRNLIFVFLLFPCRWQSLTLLFLCLSLSLSISLFCLSLLSISLS